jgi:response regulator RpfG family c-di-GMP phosphodiesterase
MSVSNDSINSATTLSENSEELLRELHRDVSDDVEASSILIVDDDEDVLSLLTYSVAALGYKVVSNSDPIEARALFSDGKTRLSCVIADFHMPKLDGLALLKEVKTHQPNASLVLLSGQADLSLALKAINSGSIFRFMVKPVRSDEMKQVLEDSVDQYNLIEKERRLQKNVFDLALSLKEANEKLEKNLEQIIEVYSDAVATFSPYLIEVDKVTRDFCRNLCALGIFSDNEAKILTLAANFHNLGLLAISRSTIKRSFHRKNELSELELSLIQEHPKIGAGLIDFLGESRSVSDVILAHHERWDGKGYPKGLRGGMIPRLSQYLALAAFYAESRHSEDIIIHAIRGEKELSFGPEIISHFDTLVENKALPPKVRELQPESLYVGMVLVRDIRNSDGSLLIARGTALNAKHLRQIHIRADNDSLELPIYAKNTT